MTGEEKGEKAVIQSRSPVDARAGIVGRARGERARHARSSERGRTGRHAYQSKHCCCGAMALLPIGFHLHGLWGVGNLYEVLPRPFFGLRLMAGISVWTDITVYRSCMPGFRSSTPSPWIG
jgi:hypothetical protein